VEDQGLEDSVFEIYFVPGLVEVAEDLTIVDALYGIFDVAITGQQDADGVWSCKFALG
jgi:hypothetical protein